MQTFLPYPSFLASAAVLDDRRLGKQRVEAFQILRALVFPTYGWKNHPAVAMWRGFTPALVGYGLAVCDEWRRRGYADAVAETLLGFTAGVPDLAELRLAGQLPPWLGVPALHASHRAALRRKDPEHYEELFAEPAAGGSGTADEPYFWPAPLFPRWPVRRTAALTLDDALAAAKLDPAGPDADAAAAALAEVRRGREATVTSAAAALAVLLALPPVAVWVSCGPDVRADEPATARLPVTARPPGRLAVSIARPAGPADLDAMAAEAAGGAGIVVHPRARLGDPVVRARLAATPPAVVAAVEPAGVRLHPGAELPR